MLGHQSHMIHNMVLFSVNIFYGKLDDVEVAVWKFLS